jgi:hypothetical protein
MEITPDALEGEFSLTTAATRLDFLSRRDSGETTLNRVADVDADDWASIKDVGTSLDVPEALELLALGEVIARKAHGSRLVGIRAALRGGAGWEEIAAALGVTPRQAWDAYAQAVDAAALEPGAAASARELAGTRP